MSLGLKRYQQSLQTHFVTFSCYHRKQKFSRAIVKDLFAPALEQTRERYSFRLYCDVVMPEHVHLLLSEPARGLLANAIQSLKISVAHRVRILRGVDAMDEPFWQRRYYDHNVRDHEAFADKVRYIHGNPVKRGLVVRPEDWAWSSFRHYAMGESSAVKIETEWAGCGG